jgi:hypothetical protein
MEDGRQLWRAETTGRLTNQPANRFSSAIDQTRHACEQSRGRIHHWRALSGVGDGDGSASDGHASVEPIRSPGTVDVVVSLRSTRARGRSGRGLGFGHQRGRKQPHGHARPAPRSPSKQKAAGDRRGRPGPRPSCARTHGRQRPAAGEAASQSGPAKPPPEVPTAFAAAHTRTPLLSVRLPVLMNLYTS